MTEQEDRVLHRPLDTAVAVTVPCCRKTAVFTAEPIAWCRACGGYVYLFPEWLRRGLCKDREQEAMIRRLAPTPFV